MHLSVKGRDCTKRDTKTQYGLPRLMIRINDGTQVRGPLSSSPKLGPHLYDSPHYSGFDALIHSLWNAESSSSI